MPERANRKFTYPKDAQGATATGVGARDVLEPPDEVREPHCGLARLFLLLVLLHGRRAAVLEPCFLLCQRDGELD